MKKKAHHLRYKLQQVEAEIEDFIPKLKPERYYCLQFKDALYYFKMHKNQQYDETYLWIDRGLCVDYSKLGDDYYVTYFRNLPFGGWTELPLVEISKEEYKEQIGRFKHCYEELCEDIDDGQN